jgi:hypothetical protein
MVEQPYGKLNIFDPGGHSAIYLDRVCAETPLKLRPCGAGELGVVISRYDGISNHDWVAIPLLPYLYAVESSEDIPQTMDKAKEDAMRDAYRRKYLEALAPDLPGGETPKGNWYELIGSAFDRTIYGFRVQTDAEDDAMLISVYNDQKNVQRYNGFYRNCADFDRVLINRIYPGSVHRNWIADVGVTSPKAVAKAVAHYGRKHPEMGLDVFVVPQVPGSLPRSHSNTGVTEGVVKRYSLPLAILSPELEGFALVAYVSRGRFRMPKDAPPLDLDELHTQLKIVQPFPMSVPDMPAAELPEVAMVADGGDVEIPAVVAPAAMTH